MYLLSSLDLDERPENTTARVGSTVLFKCYAEFAANITWTKDGAPIALDGRKEVMVNGYLKIRQVAAQDGGTYTCKAYIRTIEEAICQIQTKAKLTVFTELNEGTLNHGLVLNKSMVKSKTDKGVYLFLVKCKSSFVSAVN